MNRSLANQTSSIPPSPVAGVTTAFLQDDVALKKRLTRDDLRKREFDRKLERDLQAIDQIINFKQKSAKTSTLYKIPKMNSVQSIELR